MSTHSKAPWRFDVVDGQKRTDGSDWGGAGLWSADNKMILGQADGWEGQYAGPENPADQALIENAPFLLAVLVELMLLKIAKEGGFNGGVSEAEYEERKTKAWRSAAAVILKATDYQASEQAHGSSPD